ncbi:MAG: hypothetical protein M1821_010049 [Bathelium mastoideum]|nr:MAG: hypothetical protein M1821_010049 [Bathelium mastoideum]
MSSGRLEYVDTVVIGNGPSALILSYILHGWIPHYTGGHYDSVLDSKLQNVPDLLSLTPDLYDHFQSSLKYSTQALPINVLLDTLLRPNADTEVSSKSCVEWRLDPERAIPHLVLGETDNPGGQWAKEDGSAIWDIQALSYAEMLALPGYSFADHHLSTTGERLADFVRPSRKEVAEYFRTYPRAVKIEDSILTSARVEDISRHEGGFLVGSHNLFCNHLVLASGTFSVNIPARPLLQPLKTLENPTEPLLVIGSGFTAADAIISAPPHRKVVHIFKWAPDEYQSPLRGCHHQAYPEYATIYRLMKTAAGVGAKSRPVDSPVRRRKNNPFFSRRDWQTIYEGHPNTQVVEVNMVNDHAQIKLKLESGEIIERSVGGLECAIGRRGSLDYLTPLLFGEVIGSNNPDLDRYDDKILISGRTLRPRCEVDLQVAQRVFTIGSLTGDSLIRFAVGSCAYAAGNIMGSRGCSRRIQQYSPSQSSQPSVEDGQSPSRHGSRQLSVDSSQSPVRHEMNGNAHQDLHIDRQKLARSLELMTVENQFWKQSGWWSGGFMFS